ncbi:interleukin-17 receptor B [Garra rufa]|uniref:interleukin-17 receptor B n=1 Tax=Garra rufa TaxID=137080 RepID=UPI003CCEC3AD
MERLDCTREIVAFLFLIQWTTLDSSCLNIVKDDRPREWYKKHESNPSPLHELTAEISESQTSLIIRWSIDIDSSIHTLTGTWIKIVAQPQPETNYRCEYQPPFTSKQISVTGQEQLRFNFTVPRVSVCPSASYDILAYNIPPPSDGPNEEYAKIIKTAKVHWNADIYAVFNGYKIVVTFNTSFVVDRHTILLENREKVLQDIEGKGECKVEKCEVELEYMEHMGPYSSALSIGVECAVMLPIILLCCCIIYQIIQRVRVSERAESVRVLVVYPAVDTVFQRSVLLLAESLQSRGGVSVVIDMWETGSLAEQGPLRWINTQVDLAERVLIISPPQRTQSDDLKTKLVPSMPDDTVSASASNLFALALNLVTSAAHDPHGRDKFWVINLDHEEKCAHTELRRCRTFILQRDLKKLHQHLLSGAVRNPALPSCFRSFYYKNALEKQEINTDFPSCKKSESDSLDKNPCIFSY